MITAIAAAAVITGNCSWDRPGANPFRGNDLAAAVDHYKDIPAKQREELKAKISKRQYDDIATIKRDSIAGKNDYSDLRDMHFGSPVKVCRSVTMNKWSDQMVERGLVYCSQDTCLIVPTVCNNLSRISIRPKPPKEEPPVGGGGTPPETPVSPPGSGEPPFSSRVPPGGEVPPNPPTFETPPAAFPPSVLPPSVVPPIIYVPPIPPVVVPPPFVPPPVPEPETYLLLLLGILGIALFKKLRQDNEDFHTKQGKN